MYMYVYINICMDTDCDILSKKFITGWWLRIVDDPTSLQLMIVDDYYDDCSYETGH